MATYIVFHEESESEVEKRQILEPGGTKLEIKILEPGSYFPIFSYFPFFARLPSSGQFEHRVLPDRPSEGAGRRTSRRQTEI